MNKLYLYVCSPTSFLRGDYTFSIDATSDDAESRAKYSDQTCLGSFEFDLEADQTVIRNQAVENLKASVKATRAIAEIECNKMEAEIQSLTAIEHSPNLVGVA